MKTLSVMLLLVGCGSESAAEPSAAETRDEAAETASPAEPPSPALAEPEPVSRQGSMTVSVDGSETTLPHFPEADNMVSSALTKVTGQSASGAADKLAVTISGYDITEASFPVTVTTESGMVAMRERRVPVQVLVTYDNDEGQQYATRGSVVLDSYENGTLVGHIDEIVLNGTRDAPGTTRIENLRFSITIPVDQAMGDALRMLGDATEVDVSKMR